MRVVSWKWLRTRGRGVTNCEFVWWVKESDRAHVRGAKKFLCIVWKWDCRREQVGGVGQVGKAKEVEDVVTAESADQAVPRRIRTQGIGQRKFTTHWRKHNGQHEHTRRRRGTCFRLRLDLRPCLSNRSGVNFNGNFRRPEHSAA